MVGTATMQASLEPIFPARPWGVPRICLKQAALDALSRHIGLNVSVGTITLAVDWLLTQGGRLGVDWRAARNLGRLLGPDAFRRESL